MDRNIDYGTQWVEQTSNSPFIREDEERVVVKQLRHFYKKDKESKYSNENSYVKAFFIHHLLDYFRETRFNTHDLDLIFEKFMQEKMTNEICIETGMKINFQEELRSIFQLFKRNKEQLIADLEGDGISLIPKKNTM